MAAASRPKALLLAALALGASACATERPPEPPPRPPSSRPAKVCGRCGRELSGRTVEYRHVLYHSECYEAVGPRCGVCGKVLTGPVVRAAGGGPVYHQGCWKATAACDGCGRPAVTPKGAPRRWEDGRLSCVVCAASAIEKTRDAEDVLALARADLERQLGIDLSDVDVPIHLVGRGELMHQAGAELADPDLKAFTQVEERFEGQALRSRTFEVHVLYGLPRIGLYGVFAHELFHVAQVRAGAPRDMEPALREGSSNWVQYRLLLASGEKERAQQLLEDDDPTYGKGLRRFVAYAEKKGARAALKLGLEGTKFPPGF